MTTCVMGVPDGEGEGEGDGDGRTVGDAEGDENGIDCCGCGPGRAEPPPPPQAAATTASMTNASEAVRHAAGTLMVWVLLMEPLR
jgi:hypothetical protein